MWVFLVLMALGIAALIFSARRHAELFVIRVEGGRARVVRGRVPSRLLADIGDVVRRANVKSANIRVLSERGDALVEAPDISSGTQQQLRNVVGLHTVAQIRSGPKRRA